MKIFTAYQSRYTSLFFAPRSVRAGTFLACAALCLAGGKTHAQTLLTGFTFDTLAASPSTPQTISSNLGLYGGTIYADGTNGSSVFVSQSSGTQLNAFAGTTTNDPRSTTSAGNALALVNSTQNGKSIVLKLSDSSYQSLSLTYTTQTSGSTGFTSQQFAYSTDGTNFTNVGSAITPPSSFGTAVQTIALSSIAALNDVGTIYLRLTISGATATTGNNRFDNFQLVSGNYTFYGTSSTDFTAKANFIPTGLSTTYVTAAPNSASANVNIASTTTNSPSIGSTATALGTLIYNSGASALTLAGTATLTVNGGLDNRSSNLQTVSAPVALGAASTFNARNGGLAVSNSVNVGGNTLTLDGANTVNLNGIISGTGSLTKNGAGTTTLGAANTFSGTTTINNGILMASSTGTAGALGGTTQINVNTGGTLAFGVANQATSTTPVALAGGSINANGTSQVFGALTLSNGSSLSFGAGSTAAVVQFADSSANSWTGTLTITNYAGAVRNSDGSIDTSGGGDVLTFGNSAAALTSTQLQQIQFLNPDSSIGTFGAYIDANGNVLAAIPEPTTVLGGVLLIGAAGWSQRRRLRGLLIAAS